LLQDILVILETPSIESDVMHWKQNDRQHGLPLQPFHLQKNHYKQNRKIY